MPMVIRSCFFVPILIALSISGCGRGTNSRRRSRTPSDPPPIRSVLGPSASRLHRVGDYLPRLQCAAWVNGSPPPWTNDTDGLVVVDVWGNWCSRCGEAAPALVRIYEEYKAQGVSFVSVTTDQEAMVKSFVQRFGIPWSHGFGAAAESIGGLGAFNRDMVTPGYEVKPTLYLVKPDGQVVWCDEHSRMNHGEDIRLWAERLEDEIKEHISAQDQGPAEK
jgi:thiol-disulfide isomerase/thioredoxin